MALKLPELDDKTYADLVQEARAALPAIHPGWSDHNPSDPGIALIELFAWLTEMIIYRTGRIPERSERTFLRLLSGGAHGEEADLGAATEHTLRDLRERYRAVTAEDYEQLVATAWPSSPEARALEQKQRASSRIARSFCLPERNLGVANKLTNAPGHISLIIMPKGADPWMAPPPALLDAVFAFFAERRLITAQLHVTRATAVPISLKATVHLRDDVAAGGAGVHDAIVKALLTHLHPWHGGPDGRGWPFGRDIDLSDVLAVIDDVAGVEYVDTIDNPPELSAPNDMFGPRIVKAANGQKLGLRIDAHELPCFEEANLELDLMERRNGVWWKIQ